MIFANFAVDAKLTYKFRKTKVDTAEIISNLYLDKLRCFFTAMRNVLNELFFLRLLCVNQKSLVDHAPFAII